MQAKHMEEKLIKLRQGVTLVSAEQRQAVERMYKDMMNQWRRRKRMFKEVWDAITENSPKNLKEFKVFYHFDSPVANRRLLLMYSSLKRRSLVWNTTKTWVSACSPLMT